MLTKEQLEQRKLGIGGSDVAAICGLSKWKTPLDVFLDKIGETEEEQNESEYAYWGNILENVVAEEFQKRTGLKVYEAEETFVHKDYPFMRANVDRMIEGEDAILECKTAKFAQEWGQDGTDEMPAPYLLQVAHYLTVTQKSVAYVAVLIGGSDFRILKYTRNMELEAKIIEIEKEFWNKHVLEKFPPQAKSMGDILTLFPKSQRDKAIVANEVLEEKIYKLKELKEQMKPLEQEFENIKTELCAEIGDAEVVIDSVSGKLATFKTQESQRLDTTKLKNELPDIYQNYVKVSESRVFRLF
jgi:putative phage-type endonuclease